ncbi:hypothetical protein AMTRI_Chr07g78700 [Amborella trichopoda]|uniref:Cytochrome b561 domain-containing protein n=1 Tax=Amborella trichopoda TaxID=13333 RepID=W1PY50_AMBTC|nr:uncharacterized protein LOC18441102 [Amborella trichopoda]ERN12856.1 hypothetical protein AMTR_s00050p00032750 [Amborella trichopoda]|eukprot:XP_006851275.1 uncharacterized protein LOC18441102 [Amborella trichopoda]
MQSAMVMSSTVGALLNPNPLFITCNFRPSNGGFYPNQKWVPPHRWSCRAKCIRASISDEEEPSREVERERRGGKELLLLSFAPLPLLLIGALPGAEIARAVFGPFAETVKTWDVPNGLLHWGHPGNMAVVCLAMGGYGSYLGFRIKYSDDLEEKAKAKDLHPKLLGGMFFFVVVGATGGITSLLTSDKPIFESPHAVTGLLGLTLLTVQTILATSFEGNPGLRSVHGVLGTGIMGLFLVHAIFGLQLALSY